MRHSHDALPSRLVATMFADDAARLWFGCGQHTPQTICELFHRSFGFVSAHVYYFRFDC
jgi:hypothetical protein